MLFLWGELMNTYRRRATQGAATRWIAAATLLVVGVNVSSGAVTKRHPVKERPIAAAPPAVVALPPAMLNVTIAAGLADRAGPRRAGALCFPHGAFKVRNFAANDAAFRTIVERALRNRKAALPALVANGTTLTISLKAIKANLCARGWGAFGQGDRVSLSGNAAVTFDWAFDAMPLARRATTEVVVEASHEEGATPEEILRRAVNLVLDVIAEGSKAA